MIPLMPALAPSLPAAHHGPACTADAAGLAARLRERTRRLHREAERSGIVRELLRGRATRSGYALYLRNLLPAYRALEDGLERHRATPGVRAIVHPPLFRAGALARDLVTLAGDGWARRLPLLAPGERYGQRIAAAAAPHAGAGLVAHAYVRYLGDLGGGRILRRLLARSLGLAPEALSFYDFPDIADREAFKSAFRGDLDRAELELEHPEAVIEEAIAAFRLNVEVSEAVLASLAGRR